MFLLAWCYNETHSTRLHLDRLPSCKTSELALALFSVLFVSSGLPLVTAPGLPSAMLTSNPSGRPIDDGPAVAPSPIAPPTLTSSSSLAHNPAIEPASAEELLLNVEYRLSAWAGGGGSSGNWSSWGSPSVAGSLSFPFPFRRVRSRALLFDGSRLERRFRLLPCLRNSRPS